MDLRIDQLAIHYIDPANKIIGFSTAPEDVNALSPDIIAFFLRLVNEVVDSEDAGPTYSAKFNRPPGLPAPSLVDQHVQNILDDLTAFFDESKGIAGHLYQVSTAVASPGVLAVIQLHDQDDQPDQQCYVCLIKIRHEDRNFVTLLKESPAELSLEKISHMLLEEIQKGAIIPHPDRKDYHLKLIDKQVPGEPAKYFKDAFLGCWTKVSDDNQVRGIVATLQEFAKEQKITLQKEKIPALIAELQATKQDIDTSALAQTAATADLFSEPVESEELEKYIEEKSEIGPVDIPSQSFARRGKKGRSSRQIRYHFVDPQYKGVVISGPADVLSKILAVSGATVTFTLQTTRIGFSVEYD